MGVDRLWLGSRIARWWGAIFGRRQVRIGLYGPPTAGKTTLANRIGLDFAADSFGTSTGIPHETRSARLIEKLTITTTRGGRLHLCVVDTPGIATKIDYREFVEAHGLTEAEARTRAREATRGVVDAIQWLDEVDGVVLALDSTADPYTQVNLTLLSNLEARNVPVVVAATKVDLADANPGALRAAFPQHPVVAVSALTGFNMNSLYERMVETFR